MKRQMRKKAKKAQLTVVLDKKVMAQYQHIRKEAKVTWPLFLEVAATALATVHNLNKKLSVSKMVRIPRLTNEDFKHAKRLLNLDGQTYQKGEGGF